MIAHLLLAPDLQRIYYKLDPMYYTSSWKELNHQFLYYIWSENFWYPYNLYKNRTNWKLLGLKNTGDWKKENPNFATILLVTYIVWTKQAIKIAEEKIN